MRGNEGKRDPKEDPDEANRLGIGGGDSTNALDMTEPLKSYLAGACWPDAIPQLLEQHFERIHSTARVVLHQFFPRQPLMENP